jgi:hypothetical protein
MNLSSVSRLKLFLIMVWLIACSQNVQAQAPTREYQLKAVFLYNFTQFVNWPDNAFENDQSPLVIGVMGENPFGNYLVQTVAGEKINGRPMIVQHFKNDEEIKSCHILFINIREAGTVEQVLTAVQGKNILTVSDHADFIKQGGMIQFVTSNKIKLRVNMDACKKTGIVLSSKLLRLAEIIKNPAK